MFLNVFLFVFIGLCDDAAAASDAKRENKQTPERCCKNGSANKQTLVATVITNWCRENLTLDETPFTLDNQSEARLNLVQSV